MSEKPYWEGKEFAYFQHKKCEFFPCHNAPCAEEFNCLFCYCPLYALGDKCGGNFVYTEDGIKDCSGCSVPHRRQNYGYIMEHYGDLMKLASQNREKKD